MACSNRVPGQVFRGVATVLMVATLLAGCAGGSRMTQPAGVEDRSGGGTSASLGTPQQAAPQSSRQPGEAQVAAYQPPRTPAVVRAEPNRAVEVLVRRADDQRYAGDLDAAAASLERAVRIAPDDAMLWHRLADLRLAQGQHGMVSQLAAKSNALTRPEDGALRQANWQLIAQARRGMGDERGARDAERNAGQAR